MKTAIRLVERGVVPQPLVRRGIRKLLGERLREQEDRFADSDSAFDRWVGEMRSAPVAPVPEKANEQHYELPPEFFELCLGEHLKYSSGYYSSPETTLDEAEAAMLALTSERADLRPGQTVLELGCGWGSLTLWMASHYPSSRITAVSNSAPQREHILERARMMGLENLEVVTCDMNEFAPAGRFDRVVSVEMFEHMRNWEELLGRISTWLADEGRVFLHVFAHKRYAYPFEVRGESDWMGQYFFTGGMMPSHDLIDRLDVPFEVDRRWEVPGEHYARTSEDWLTKLEQGREQALEILAGVYGPDQASLWYQRWRVFFLSCAELFAFRGGSEWIVSHTRLKPSGPGAGK